MKRSGQLLLAVCFTMLSACVGPSGRIAPIPLDRRVDDAPAIQTRLQLKETFVFNVGVTRYMLPYGPYYPDGQDERGIYYRAPIPIARRGFLGAESLVLEGWCAGVQDTLRARGDRQGAVLGCKRA